MKEKQEARRRQARSVTRFLGEHYPSGAAQAVFIRLVPPVTVRVALVDAENSDPESSSSSQDWSG